MTTLNVFRYLALGTGVVYGFAHTQTLKKKGAKQTEEYEFAQQEKLVADAKAQWAKEHPVKAAPTAELDLESKDIDWPKVIEDAVKSLDAQTA